MQHNAQFGTHNYELIWVKVFWCDLENAKFEAVWSGGILITTITQQSKRGASKVNVLQEVNMMQEASMDGGFMFMLWNVRNG